MKDIYELIKNLIIIYILNKDINKLIHIDKLRIIK